MKHLRTVAVFVVGFVAGALVIGLTLARWERREFEARYLMGVADQANVARQIQAGRSAELVAKIRRDMPASVRAVAGLKTIDDPAPVLWSVRSFYEESSLAVPPEIEPILASLPPRQQRARRPPTASSGTP